MKILGAVLYENFELLDLYGPLEMFGDIVPDLKIVTVAEQLRAIRSAAQSRSPGPASGRC